MKTVIGYVIYTVVIVFACILFTVFAVSLLCRSGAVGGC